ncbi:4-diphosphocytidyl-2-C-methyl-D-erythritol kinase [hydrothermal vent metagenome]|uniref:4-diphosphocytidyl-2-C-methyl-D-erythritol kinase n=1 Tax=hydrothermal vent metagenome TaxID=652676 RepID=A0A3B1CUY7_9ZZZZ
MKKTYLSPAKINILLKVTGKKNDGYHEIVTIFQKISLFDKLVFEITDNGKIKLSCDDPDIPTDEGNLVVKAGLALKRLTSQNLGANVKLKKRIPVAAGLGGGSSNAATTLVALNSLWNINAPAEKLAKLALNLGADVPFFLSGPAALACGIGEKLTPILPEKSVSLLLVNPGFGLSAGDAYKEAHFSFEPFSASQSLIEDIKSGNPAKISKHMENDLETWALKKSPKLALLKQQVESTKPAPLKTMVSGSGPTLLAIYECHEQAMEAKKNLQNEAPFLACVKTVTLHNPKPM